MEAAAAEEEVQAEANADNDDDDDASHLLLCGLMTLPKLRLTLCPSPSLLLTHSRKHTHTVSHCCCSPAKLRRRRRRRAMWSCLNLILCALHTPLPRAVPALPLPHCPSTSVSRSHSLSPYQFYWLRPIYIFKLFREVFRELCQVYEEERERSNAEKELYMCRTMMKSVRVSLHPPPPFLSLTVWEWMSLTYSSVACSALKAHKNRQSKLSLNAIKRRQLQREIT